MNGSSATYRRLPGRSKTFYGHLFGQRQRLYAAPDHLLIVNSIYYRERYKRFYLRDIQAITLTRTRTGPIMNVMLAGLTLLFLLWAVAAYFVFAWPAGVVVLLGLFALAFASGAGVNALLGPTCRCLLYTAVQCEELSCLGRLRTARRVCHGLRGPIEDAQGGGIDPAELDALAQQQRTGTAPAAPASNTQWADSGTVSAHQETGSIHGILFVLLLIDAAMSLLQLTAPNLIPSAVSLIYLTLVIATTVAALIRQRGGALPARVRNVTWVTFGYLCFIVGILYVFVVMNAMRQSMGEEVPAPMRDFETMLNYVMNAISIVFDLVLGFAGLGFLNEFKRAKAAALRGPDSRAVEPREEG